MTHLNTTLLHDYLDGELSSDQKEGVENHLAACERCRLEFEALKRLKVALSRVETPNPGPVYFKDLNDRIAARTSYHDIGQTKPASPVGRSLSGRDTLKALIRLAAVITLLFASFYISQIVQENRSTRWADKITQSKYARTDSVESSSEIIEPQAGINRVGSPPPVENTGESDYNMEKKDRITD
jgi:hypothetical protein